MKPPALPSTGESKQHFKNYLKSLHFARKKICGIEMEF